MALVMAISLCACGGGVTPEEQLTSYIEKNGTQNGEVYESVYAAGGELIKTDSPMGDMGNNLAAVTTEEICVLSIEDGNLYIEVIDKESTNNGITMDRGVKLNILEGTADYHNSLIYNGMDMGGTMEVQVPISGYTADAMPTIVNSKFASGSNVTDDMKNAMQGYVNLTMDCFVSFVEDELGLTGADFGSVWMPILGWAIVAIFAAVLTILIIRKNRQLKDEYALNAKSKQTAGV